VGLGIIRTFLDGYCSTVQGLLDWFEVDLGFTELLFIQIDLCVMCVFVLYSPVSLSSCPFFGHPALPPPHGGSASRVGLGKIRKRFLSRKETAWPLTVANSLFCRIYSRL